MIHEFARFARSDLMGLSGGDQSCKNNFPTHRNNFPTCQNNFPTCQKKIPNKISKTWQHTLDHNIYITIVIIIIMLTLKYFSAVNGEASSALCLFVCSAIRGQGTIQWGGSSYFFIESKFLFCFSSICLFLLLQKKKFYCLTISGDQVSSGNENIYKLSAIGWQIPWEHHKNLLQFDNKS